jgi:hypothetical protein
MPMYGIYIAQLAAEGGMRHGEDVAAATIYCTSPRGLPAQPQGASVGLYRGAVLLMTFFT